MSNRPDRRRQQERRKQEPPAPDNRPGGEVPTSSRDGGKKETIHLRSTQSLERLRNRVEEAALELRRLREENRALAQRVAELEAKPSAPGTAVLTVDDPPELLQRKIDTFIEAIDQYLKHEKPEP
jgi:hypothetical protein